jgi:response regulator RpfG family c-di-GMP phosphodiesterase
MFQPNTPAAAVPTVLYVDDEEGNRTAFQAAFRREFHVVTAAGLEEALRILEQLEVHVAICDQRMPGVPGHEVLRCIKEMYPAVRRMLITAYADLQALVDALNQAGVCHYIRKPWDAAEVRTAVLRAFAERQAEADRNARMEFLLESNRQLEFALRQRLLS